MSNRFYMKKTFLARLILMLFLFGGVFLLALGCSSDSDAPPPPSVVYSGLTTPAVITAENAKEIAEFAYSSIGSNETFINLGGVGTPAQPLPGSPFAYKLWEMFDNLLWQADLAALDATPESGAVQSYPPETRNGTCGGSATMSGQVDDQTGQFSGSFVFNGYCEDGITANGSGSLSGQFDIQTREMESFVFTFTYLTMSGAGESISMGGSLTMTATGISANLTMRDNTTGKYLKMENYSLNTSQGVTGQTMSISGRFYDSDYGYVTLSTPTPLSFSYSDDTPGTGVILVQGANQTAARLTVQSTSTYIVEADLDGDGDFDDYSSGTLYWANL